MLAADAPAFEDTPLQLNSALIVPDKLMAGPGYKVDTVATNDGFNNTYLVETSFGNLETTSDYQLARTIQEIQALLPAAFAADIQRIAVVSRSDREVRLPPRIDGLRVVVTPDRDGRTLIELSQD